MMKLSKYILGACLLLASSSALAQESQPLPAVATAPESAPYDYAVEENRVLGKVVKVTFAGLNAFKEDVVADVATLKTGDVFTRKKLENSINDLRKWGIFSVVEVIVQYDGDQIELDYQLKEGFIIKDISIRGNYPLLEKKVQRVMFLNRGAIYYHEKLAEQIDRLEKLYQQEGYYGTTVLAVEDYDEENHEVKLLFRIKKGVTYRLRNTEIKGNTALNPKRIRSIIFTFFHYKPKQIKKDLQKITGLYRDKGFVRARVRLDGENFDQELRKVDIEVLVRQGPQVQVFFQGNNSFKRKKLKKQITVYEGGDFDEFELEASKKKLMRFYLERGFEEVKVTWDRKKIDAEHYNVTFNIEEGLQRKVKKIEFEGNEDIRDKRLKKMIATRKSSLGEKGYYLQALFEEDLKTIETFYHEEGYLDAEVKDWEKNYNLKGDKVDLGVQIEEGEQAKVKSLDFTGVPKAMKEEIAPKLLLREGEAYSPYRAEKDLETLLIYFAEEGYPYAEVQYDHKEVETDLYHIAFKATLGHRVKIGRVLFVGNTATRESVLRKNMRFKEGDYFSTKTILQSQINIRGLGVFSNVDIETLGLTSQRDVVNAVVRVQEKKPKIIDVEVGYITDYGFSGSVIFNKLNLWGLGKNANTKLQIGQELSRFELNYIDPRFLGKSLQLTVGSYAGIENRPFYKSKSVGSYGSIFKEFGQKMSAYGSLTMDYVNFGDDDTVFEVLNPQQNPNSRTRLTTTVGTTYDGRDNFGDPHSGFYLNGNASLTNEFFQYRGNYSTLKANLGYWYSPFARLTIANALRVAGVIPFPDGTIVPPDSRLYLGGDDTVRGFKQDSLLPSGGTFSLVENLELQFRVYGSFQVVGFLDTGMVTNGLGEVSLAALRNSAGMGLRYVTPVGPIRLDYAFVLDKQDTDPSSSRLHFAFGYFF